MTVSSVKDESSQVPAYPLTYIFPFAFATIGNTSAALAYAVFARLLVVLLLRTDLSLVNPVLLAAGIHSYAVTTSTGAAVTLLARAAPLPGSHNAEPFGATLWRQARLHGTANSTPLERATQ